MNLVDPRFFRQDAGVGEWVDAMVHRRAGGGGAARCSCSTGSCRPASRSYRRATPRSRQRRAVGGAAQVQVVPSGPGVDVQANLRILVDAVGGPAGA